jgi:hypothetical protein
VGVRDTSAPRIGTAAEAAALAPPALLIACVVCAFAYDVDVGLGGLVAAFLLALVPLTLVGFLDVLSWRALRAGRDLSLRTAAAETSGYATAGLALLLLGSVVTVVEVGVGGEDKLNDFAVWTSTAVGYLLLSALVVQAALLVLSLLMRREAIASEG